MQGVEKAEIQSPHPAPKVPTIQKQRSQNRMKNVPSPRPGLHGGQHRLPSLESFRFAFSSRSKLNVFDGHEELKTATQEEYEVGSKK